VLQLDAHGNIAGTEYTHASARFALRQRWNCLAAREIRLHQIDTLERPALLEMPQESGMGSLFAQKLLALVIAIWRIRLWLAEGSGYRSQRLSKG